MGDLIDFPSHRIVRRTRRGRARVASPASRPRRSGASTMPRSNGGMSLLEGLALVAFGVTVGLVLAGADLPAATPGTASTEPTDGREPL